MNISFGSLRRMAGFVTVLSILLAAAVALQAQSQEVLDDRDAAIELIEENRYLDALPILERIILHFPDDAELWAEFGIAIMSNSVILPTEVERKDERERGLKALRRAQQLGTENEKALALLEDFERANDFDNYDVSSENPEVVRLLREGESYFGRGDYDNAFKTYEKAHKLEPENYEAVLFMGDCFYAQKKFAESEAWFAKAAKIDQDREIAHRFWGDALLYQQKYSAALEKFVDAVVADPYSRRTWNALESWAEEAESELSFISISPPGNESEGVISVNESLLRADDGTKHWKAYNDALRGSPEEPGFASVVRGWKNVAAAFRKDLAAGRIKYPDQDLVALLRLDDEGLLEAYILMLRPHQHFGEDYVKYREGNRDKLRLFIKRYITLQE